MIENIIFDLGGVLLNLDVNRTFKAFEEYSQKPFDLKTVYTVSFFDDYEEGKISDEAFRNEMRKFLGVELTDNQIDKAWNAMLLDMPAHRIEILEQLSQKKRLFLLSNTNAIHKRLFDQIMADAGFGDFEKYFEKAYYSHHLGIRKPKIGAFEHILRENNLQADQTLFIDDTAMHIGAAQSIGIKAVQVPANTLSLEFFDTIF